MRYATLLAALAGLVAIAAFTAPAGAAERPTAVDFSQPVPASEQLREATLRSQRAATRRKGYGLEGPILYRSVPAEAERRFDMVGIAGELHALEFRARRDGQEWSRWVESDNGDPVYTGGTDQVQVRSRGVPIEGRLHFVRMSEGNAPAASLASQRAKPRGKRRGAPAPKYVSRAEWGANSRRRGCKPRGAPDLGKVKAGAIHHTVSTNRYSEAEVPSMVLGICRFHRDANGWDDIGYNALVDRFGNLYEGRGGGLSRPLVGAHAEGVNSQTTGIAAIGDHRDRKATTRERRSIVRYLAWKLDLAGREATGRVRLLSAGGGSARADRGERVRVRGVFSHSDTNFTECAGGALRAQIPKIRLAVQKRMDRFGGGDPVDPVEPVEPAPGGSTP